MGVFSRPPPPPPPTLEEKIFEFATENATPVGIASTLVVAVIFWRFASWFATFVFSTQSTVDKKLAEADARRRKYRAQIINLTFRALKSIAMADGEFVESEREAIILCSKTLHVKCPDLDAIPPITPRALATSALGQEPEKVALVLTLMCHFSLIDGEEHPSEFKLVEKFAREFGVEHRVLCARHRPSRPVAVTARRPRLDMSCSQMCLCLCVCVCVCVCVR